MNSRFANLIEISGIANCLPSDLKAFKSCMVEHLFEMPSSLPDIIHVLCVKSNIRVNSTKVLYTPKSKSWDGQNITGKKLLIEGDVENIVEFISDDTGQKVYNSKFTKPFTSYIIPDDDFNEYSEYNINPYIEDIFVLQQDRRWLYISVIFTLAASIHG